MKREIYNLRLFLLDLPKSWKITIYLFVDILLCLSTTLLSFYLRLGEFFPLKNALTPAFISIIYFIIGVSVFYISYYGAKKRGTLMNMGE